MDFTGVAIEGGAEAGERGARGEGAEAAPGIVLPHQAEGGVGHFAVDIGGSLAKLVYFSGRPGGAGGGALHFVKFETARLGQAVDFIERKGLHRACGGAGAEGEGEGAGSGGAGRAATVRATGGGALKYAGDFEAALGLKLQHADEMECLVRGANFLLRALGDESFVLDPAGGKHFVSSAPHPDGIFPYLLVNIGSGVSIVKVTGDREYERVSGTALGGGTFSGLGRLLTGCRSFDEILELSAEGDNKNVDMLVGDIYGGLDYESIGLSKDTIASSFGKILMEPDRDVEDYKKADIALALVRMISYNIGQIAYLNAKRYGLQRIYFAGFFIRGHPATMRALSYSVGFWSNKEMQATFLRHEGFIGAMGAFLGTERGKDIMESADPESPRSRESPLGGVVARKDSRRSQFRESFTMGAPFSGGEVHGPAFNDLGSKLSWVEKFVGLGTERLAGKGRASAGSSGELTLRPSRVSSDSAALDGSDYDIWGTEGLGPGPRLHVGVLHVNPQMQAFPLLRAPDSYEPNTVDILTDAAEREFWIGVLEEQVPLTAEKAVTSVGGAEEAVRQGKAFSVALRAHLEKLRREPGVYGRTGLADLLEMREECLREFGFSDIYWQDKEAENAAALQVLPDLLREMDAEGDASKRLLALIRGALAGNIFDWGSKACVDLYRDGTILGIYKEACARLKERPWRVDSFDALQDRFEARPWLPYQRAVVFVDNSGADVVLGVIPLVRELLQRGTEVVMAANSAPALNDVTSKELHAIVEKVTQMCGVVGGAVSAARRAVARAGGMIPEAAPAIQRGEVPALYVVASGHGSPCLDLRRVSQELAMAARGADLVVLEGMGRAVHTNFRTKFTCDSLKLAMVKNSHLAKSLLGGVLYDCVCMYEPGGGRRGAGGAGPMEQ